MNNERRKEARRAIDLLDEAKAILELIAEEEEQGAQSLPESFADKCDAMQEAADELFQAAEEVGEASNAIANAIEK